MKTNKRIPFVILLFFLGSLNLSAQDSFNSGGGNATGATGNSSYSVGQVVYTAYASTAGSMTEGVQQPFEISVVLGIEHREIQLEAIAYPNPTLDYVHLQINNVAINKLDYRITDINGSIIKRERISQNRTTIPMYQLASATYFLSITKDKQVLKTFKIVKK